MTDQEINNICEENFGCEVTQLNEIERWRLYEIIKSRLPVMDAQHYTKEIMKICEVLDI